MFRFGFCTCVYINRHNALKNATYIAIYNMTEASLLLKNMITISISNIKANICKACILARNISLMNFEGFELEKERLGKNIIQPFRQQIKEILSKE